MSKLALLGGNAVRKKPIPAYNTIGFEEKKAAQRVLDKGILSQFYGSNSPEFYGGLEVQEFEKEWVKFMNSLHAISMNSATSGLYAAIGALEIGPGDEVIVSPYTMTASAAGILVYNAIPIFADIEEETFCLDPKSIEEKITPRTKAIVVTHLFGHPADMENILKIANRYKLRVVEDCAQSAGAFYKGARTGTFGDIGVFSLNCHKIIQTGEGGVCTTKDNELAKRLKLIRNHAEAVISDGMEVKSVVNMLGWNYRMGELEAAIGREQLKKLNHYTEQRQQLADVLTKRLLKIKGLRPPIVKEDCTHGYYIYPVMLDDKIIEVSRDLFAKALDAEGIPVMAGYVSPLYNQIVYQKKLLYGKNGCPFSCPYYEGNVKYHKGLCPTTEKVQEKLLGFEYIRDPLNDEDINQIADAFEKIIENIDDLKEYGKNRN